MSDLNIGELVGPIRDRASNITSAVGEKWTGLQPRERIFIVGAVIALFCMVLFTVFHSMYNDITKKAAETENYRKSLNYIAENQAQYKLNQARSNAMRETLEKADSKISNKLSSIASNLGFSDVSVTPKDSRRTSDDSGAEETEIDVSLKNVDYTKVLEYLVEIQKLDSPIYMRQINMTRTSSANSSDTKMSVTITLMSYRLKEQNAT
ncbi:MAG: type II secretion system protein M [Proteobacteria bacterium]|nr:type II secretion system protein M [Pseudomonadota bacterium]